MSERFGKKFKRVFWIAVLTCLISLIASISLSSRFKWSMLEVFFPMFFILLGVSCFITVSILRGIYSIWCDKGEPLASCFDEGAVGFVFAIIGYIFWTLICVVISPFELLFASIDDAVYYYSKRPEDEDTLDEDTLDEDDPDFVEPVNVISDID